MVLLDESHCSAHTYADLGQVALDIFTCGKTSPETILDHLRQEIDIGSIAIRKLEQFPLQGGPIPHTQESGNQLGETANP